LGAKREKRDLIRIEDAEPAGSVPEGAASPFLHEALFGIEVLLLHASPVFYGIGVPRGDGSAVVVIPGFLGSDIYLVEFFAWLRRLGYAPYFSGIGLNDDCPNLLIRRHLTETLDQARRETRRKVHLLGHSLGGLLARAAAAERPKDVASVITLGSPFRGPVVHPELQRAVEAVRQRILATHGKGVLPECYTGRCTCSFVGCLRRDFPPGLLQTAIYSRTDGLVDWRYCVTGDPACDFEVSGTHVGLAFNPTAYRVIAERLAAARGRRRAVSRTGESDGPA
jgi:pimeloyl-ACP methyl ester carboxylesterase